MALASEEPAAADITQAIRRYLALHPHAVDTERGIREWWLGNRSSRASADDVRAALEQLVAAGEIVVLSLPDGQRAYGGAKTDEPVGPVSVGRTSQP
jgi:hypothetical protein